MNTRPHTDRRTANSQCRQITLGRRVAAIVASAVLASSFGGCERWELDRQMESLCKKDGGVKVYETVTLPASEFGPADQPLAKYIPIAKSDEDYLGPDYRYVRTMDVLVGKNVDIESGKGRLRMVCKTPDQACLHEHDLAANI